MRPLDFITFIAGTVAAWPRGNCATHRQILSVGEILRRLAAETEAALSKVSDLGEAGSQRAKTGAATAA
jgi:hypothetical protein